MFRAVGFSRAQPIVKQGGEIGGNGAFAHYQTAADNETFILSPPGFYVTQSGQVCSIADCLLDTIFDDKRFTANSFTQGGVLESALQLYQWLPTSLSKDYNQAANLIENLNSALGRTIFTRLRVNQNDRRRGRDSDDTVNKTMYDSIIARPWGRGVAKKTVSKLNSDYCAHCFRKSAHVTYLRPLFTHKSAFKKYCTLCTERFKGRRQPAFAVTAKHFQLPAVQSSAASRKYIRQKSDNDPQMSVVQAIESMFEQTDLRELVAYTDEKMKTGSNRLDRILCGTLRMAMPLRKLFHDGAQWHCTSKFKTIACIFKACPDRAVAIWELEQKTNHMWSKQDWCKLMLSGRMFLRGPQTLINGVLKSDLIGRVSEDSPVTPASELLLCFDNEPDWPYPFPLIVSSTTAFVLQHIFVKKNVHIHITLDSQSSPARPVGTDIANLDLSKQPDLDLNRLVLSNAELLTFDLLHWILDRKSIWGSMEIIEIELKGNYSAAVRNMNHKIHGYFLGSAFVELVDIAMTKTYASMSVHFDQMYTPERESGEVGRCAELERAAYSTSGPSGLNWPPALPYERYKPAVPLKTLISLLEKNQDRCAGWALYG